MKQITVFLNYQSALNTEAVLPLRVLDADGGLVAEAAASASEPALIPVPAEDQPLFVRLTWPSGKTETKRVVTDDVVFSTASPRTEEMVSSTQARQGYSSILDSTASASEVFETSWIRLWQFWGGQWTVAPTLPNSHTRVGTGMQVDFDLSPFPHCLQIGGRHVPWRFVTLPPNNARILITPDQSKDGRAEPLKVMVTGFRAEAEALIEFLSRDSIRAASAISQLSPLAFNTLEQKHRDPLAAVAGAYLMLRTHGWKEVPETWFSNLARSTTMPDAEIIEAVTLIRKGLPKKSSVSRVWRLIENSFDEGLPVFAEGLSLLQEARSALGHSTTTHGVVLDRIERLLAAKLWAGASLSFAGADPVHPDPVRKRGQPGDYKRWLRKSNSSRAPEPTGLFWLRAAPRGDHPPNNAA